LAVTEVGLLVGEVGTWLVLGTWLALGVKLGAELEVGESVPNVITTAGSGDTVISMVAAAAA
jgi:hypothetical protein